MIDQLRARFRRWLYLISSGMYRGECPFDVWEGSTLVLIGSGRPTKTPGIVTHKRIFWEHPR